MCIDTYVCTGVYLYKCIYMCVPVFVCSYRMYCLHLPEGVTKDLTKEITFALNLKGLGISGGGIYIREKM